jgi:mono/diheme cytochrome c family protein
MNPVCRRVGIWLSTACVWGAAVAMGASPATKVERGKYLVEKASMCIDCHTPMTAKGEPDFSRNMTGADVFFKATIPVPAWADQAPALAGLVGYTDAQAIGILQTGLKDGQPLRPPMPAFRFNREDAEAIVAYLRTLKPQASPARKR